LSDYSNEEKTINKDLFPGKIAIVTDHVAVNDDDFHSSDRLIEKYGSDKVIHVTWPEKFMSEQEKMMEVTSTLAEDREIKILIINQAVPGTNAAIDLFKKTRNDVFIVYVGFIHEIEVYKRANLLLSPNQLDMGPAMVKQAKKQGAKAFVHYSFPRHMAQPIVSSRQKLIQKVCEAEGVEFVDATAPDPTGEAGHEGATRFILEDVPKLVAIHGEDTAFFCTNCFIQAPLIKAVVDCHAIYTQPCCPSPFHGFPEALGITSDKGKIDLNYLISEACRIAEEKNMTDRLSTWPVSASIMFTSAGAEYAIKWLNGEVPKNRIDDRVLLECMNEYIKEIVGEGVEVEMTSYSENGETCENFKLLLMSYLDF